MASVEANLSPARIEFIDPTRTVAFNGMDMLHAEELKGPLPRPPGTTPASYWVRIYLDGQAKATYGPHYDVDLRPGLITNQPTWTNDKGGVQACLADIAPIIRAIPTGPFPLVKNSVVYDGGAIQLENDELAPAADHYYGTDGAGVRGYHPLPAAGVEDVTGSAPISVTEPVPGTKNVELLVDGVTNAYLANMPAYTVKMNNTGAPANPVDAIMDQLSAVMDAEMTDPYVHTSALQEQGYAPIFLQMGG